MILSRCVLLATLLLTTVFAKKSGCDKLKVQATCVAQDKCKWANKRCQKRKDKKEKNEKTRRGRGGKGSESGEPEPKVYDCAKFTGKAQTSCHDKTEGQCWIDEETEECVKRESLPAECTPCVGFPQEECSKFTGIKRCNNAGNNAEGLENVFCSWESWLHGPGCTEDWTNCEESCLRGIKFCNERTQGKCNWDNFYEKGYERDFPDCTPCWGGGDCDVVRSQGACDKMSAQGCVWKGWQRGDNCSNVEYGYRCYDIGDPHIQGYEANRREWDFMGYGEYWVHDGPSLRMQARQQLSRGSIISSNFALAWYGPEYTYRGNKVSHTCYNTYELHTGSRADYYSVRDDYWHGPHEWDPVLIITSKEGTRTVHVGVPAIIKALQDTCPNKYKGKAVENPESDFKKDGKSIVDDLKIRFINGEWIKIERWVHPTWGMGIYNYVKDTAAYNPLAPEDTGYNTGMCNLECNYLDCDSEDNMFVYYPPVGSTAAAGEIVGEYELKWKLQAALYRPVLDQIENRVARCKDLATSVCDNPGKDVVENCPKKLKEAAQDICKPFCPKSTTRMCVYDSCAINDVAAAKEYVGSCEGFTPVAAPVLPPTNEPTPSPTLPKCGAIFSADCQINSDECGVLGGYLQGLKKKSKKVFSILFSPDTKENNTCSCEQFCMVKGGSYWRLSEDKDRLVSCPSTSSKKKRGRRSRKAPAEPKVYTVCDCFDKTAVKAFIGDAWHKKVIKGVKSKTPWYAGSVVKQTFDQDAGLSETGEGAEGEPSAGG